MTSLSDSDESSGDLSSEWTKVDASPKGDEAEPSAIVTDASAESYGVVADVNEASVEKLGSSGTVTSEAGAAPDGIAATGQQQQLFLMAKEIGVIQHVALEV